MSELNAKRKIPLVVTVMAAAGVVVGLLAIFAYCLLRNPTGQSTNDAYVSADFTVIAPRVTGQIQSLVVEDNQVVRKGQLLAKIDDSDYAAAMASAEGNVAIARATIHTVEANMTQQQSLIDQAVAALAATNANSVFAREDFDRYTDLARHGAGSLQNAQQARSRIATAQAEVARNKAALKASHQQIAVLHAQRERAEAALEYAQAALDTAHLNLSWTRVVAPIDGMVGRRLVRDGAYVTPGTPMLAIVPLRKAYVLANFQETQLRGVHPGQAADIRIDTYPGVVLHGTVDSLAPATGVTFATIAPDNATGNFTKVVQRIPVKIVLRPGQAALDSLRVGMSADATIHTADGNGDGDGDAMPVTQPTTRREVASR